MGYEIKLSYTTAVILQAIRKEFPGGRGDES